MDSVEPIDRTSAERLAELVVHLTDCDPYRALDLIDLTDASQVDGGDKLAIVARAMVRLRRTSTNLDLRDKRVEPDLRDNPGVADLRDEAIVADRRDENAPR